jgi:hypothetical protein
MGIKSGGWRYNRECKIVLEGKEENYKGKKYTV